MPLTGDNSPGDRAVIDAVAPGDTPLEDRLAAARAANPALDPILGGLIGSVIHPSILEAPGPQNVVPQEATLTLSCIVLPGTTQEELEAELRSALGDGDYELDVNAPKGASSRTRSDEGAVLIRPTSIVDVREPDRKRIDQLRTDEPE